MAKRNADSAKIRESGGGGRAGQRALDESTRILLLKGPDLYLRCEHLATLRRNIETKMGQVEVVRFAGAKSGGCSAADVLDELRSFSLMQSYKIVVVDDAEEFISREGNRRLFERYAESPVENATLVLRAETWRPGNLDGMIDRVGCIVACESPKPEQAATFCIQRTAKRHRAEIDPLAAELLVERIGTDLARLDAELGKLALMADVGGTSRTLITADLVAEEVGAAREEKAWALQGALVSGDPAIAVTKVRELLDVSRQPPELLRFYMIDLARKAYAAARLLQSGMAPHAVSGALRLFRGPGEAILAAAETHPPHHFADLLAELIESDVRAKSGFGDPERGLERLAIRFVNASI